MWGELATPLIPVSFDGSLAAATVYNMVKIFTVGREVYCMWRNMYVCTYVLVYCMYGSIYIYIVRKRVVIGHSTEMQLFASHTHL